MLYLFLISYSKGFAKAERFRIIINLFLSNLGGKFYPFPDFQYGSQYSKDITFLVVHNDFIKATKASMQSSKIP